MFTLIRRSSVKDLTFVQAPSFLVALATAEFFYKFHSFLLEVGAFLVTWLVLDATCVGIRSLVKRRQATRP